MRLAWVSVLCAGLSPQADAGTLFEDDFKSRLGNGWSWVREDSTGWRISPEGLQLRVQPGNMWGPPNDAKNVLIRPAPAPGQKPIQVTVRVHNQPTEQYEQVDLVWYYNDSNMVKLGQERVDGQLSIVMGREEKDMTRTLAIIPLDSPTVELRLVVQHNEVTGFFRTPANPEWRRAGSCTLPAAGEPKISLQAYQGPRATERWATLSAFRMEQD